MDKRFYGENRRRLAAHMTGNDAMLFFSGESVRKPQMRIIRFLQTATSFI